jgi:hypothetical protein
MPALKPAINGKAAFEIFRDQAGHWCARRMDGLVFGLFVERDAAIRFARMECYGAAALNFTP